MTDDGFNMSLRKFLKTVGVTSQQEIEEAVRSAREAGGVPGDTVTAVSTRAGFGSIFHSRIAPSKGYSVAV